MYCGHMCQLYEEDEKKRRILIDSENRRRRKDDIEYVLFLLIYNLYVKVIIS